jgi:hypothetical protein
LNWAKTDKGLQIWRLPIIAWRVGGDGDLRAVIPDAFSDDETGARMLPDGQVVIPCEQIFDNYEAFVVHLKAKVEKAAKPTMAGAAS